jgi:uncharacterized integral membrane protein
MIWILVVAFFAFGVGLLFTANMAFARILDLVNDRLPPGNQISPIGANRRAFEIGRLYKEYYPEGQLNKRSWCAGIAGIICIVVAFVLLVS